jgi:precorrin-8X/cobalt-precorrin-8 methylmutase
MIITPRGIIRNMTTEQKANTNAGNLENLEEFTELTVEVDPELVKICDDSGARTEEAKAIYMKSRTMIREIVGNSTPEDRFRQRCVLQPETFGLPTLCVYERPHTCRC